MKTEELCWKMFAYIPRADSAVRVTNRDEGTTFVSQNYNSGVRIININSSLSIFVIESEHY